MFQHLVESLSRRVEAVTTTHEQPWFQRIVGFYKLGPFSWRTADLWSALSVRCSWIRSLMLFWEALWTRADLFCVCEGFPWRSWHVSRERRSCCVTVGEECRTASGLPCSSTPVTTWPLWAFLRIKNRNKTKCSPCRQSIDAFICKRMIIIQ